MFTDISYPAIPEANEPHPSQKAETGGCGDEDVPIPKKDVDFLVE